jgi:hypothetical protein
MVRAARISSLALAAVVSVASSSGAQTVEWGAKAGINSSSVNAVPDYYDWLLCCHPLFPGAMVDATAGTGFTAGGFAALSIHRRFAVQGELMFSRRRHSVDLRPYEEIQATFTRDYVEAFGLARLNFPVAGQTHIYVAAGPVFGFRVGEQAHSSDPSLRRTGSATDIYVVQALAYGAPELLRKPQVSSAVVAGWVYRGLLVEVRLTQGLTSIFKDREGLVSAFVDLGGHEPTLRRLIAQFGPFLESAKTRDVAVLAGFRF